MSRRDPLADHVRRLGNHDLNELLVQLSKPTFAALVDVALARPVLPAGLLLRYELAPGVDGWTVVACAPRRRLGTLDPRPRPERPPGVAGLDPGRRPGPDRRHLLLAASRGRGRGPGLGHPGQPGPLAGPGRPRPRPPDPELHELLRALPRAVFDGLLEAAYASEGTAA